MTRHPVVFFLQKRHYGELEIELKYYVTPAVNSEDWKEANSFIGKSRTLLISSYL
jgi:hypothetical protein